MAKLLVKVRMNDPASWNELASFTSADVLCWAVSQMTDAMIESGVKEADIVVQVYEYRNPRIYGSILGTVRSSDVRKEVEYESRVRNT